MSELVDERDLPAGRQAQNSMIYYTYALDSIQRNYIYVGITDSPPRRIDEHNSGYNKTTKPYAPFKTLLIEEYPTRQAAREREKYLKSGVGKEFLKKLRK